MGEIIGRSEEGIDAEHTTENFFSRFQLYNERVQAIHIWMLRSRYACSNVGLTNDVFA